MVNASVEGAVLLGTNYPGQVHTLFRASFTAGSAMARAKLWVRFCADPDCADPLALLPAQVAGANANGMYVFSTADLDGTGFHKPFSVTRAPLGRSYVQVVGDTEASQAAGRGACTDVLDCPGDLDVVQSTERIVEVNNDGKGANPPRATVPLDVTEEGATVSLGTLYLSHVVMRGDGLWAPRPADPGRLLAAMSNAEDTYRNFLALVDLSDAESPDGAVLPDSYVLTKGDGTFQGDVCGMVRAGETLYAVAIDNDGANIFTLDAATGLQTSSTPVVTIPPSNPADAETYPRPCRGVMADGVLYLVEFKGAGALTSSRPHPLYVVDVANGTHATPMDGFQLNAWRSVAVNREGNRLFLLDPSWSVDSVNRGVLMNRIYVATITAPGQLETPVPFTTQTRSDDNCESTNHWPGTLVVADVGGVESLLLGHDLGVETYDARDLSWTGSVDMTSFGRLFGQLTAAPGNPTRLYAVPQCKALTANSDFTLPYAGGTEPSDKNLVAALDASGETLVVAATNLDINGDGTFDHGIDLDFWAVKAFIRGAGSLLPIPPVVFTAPQVAVGRTLLFVRGTGIQGNGSTSLSSSGLGQVQDVGFFDLSTGAGLVFNGYMPWRHGLSAEAGTGAAIWGWDVWRGRESSVGWLEYLP